MSASGEKGIRVERDDAPAACADRPHVQRRDVVLVLAVARRTPCDGIAAADHPDIEGGAAHVTGEHVQLVATVVIRCLSGARQTPRTDETGHRSGTDRQQRQVTRLSRVDDTSRASHDEELAGVTKRGQLGFKIAQVRARHGPDQGIDHRGDRALVLPDTRHHGVRERHEGVGAGLADELRHAELVVGVHDRPQQRDRERLDAGVDEPCDRRAAALLVEFGHCRAIEGDTLVELLDELSRDERLWLGLRRDMCDVAGVQTHESRAGLHHEDGVGVPRGGEQPHFGRAGLDQCVGSDGAPVVHPCALLEQRPQLDADPRGGLAERRDEPSIEIGRRRRGLADRHVPLTVDHDAVGERTADVDADDVRTGHQANLISSRTPSPTIPISLAMGT